jgi:hypothetical protein
MRPTWFQRITRLLAYAAVVAVVLWFCCRVLPWCYLPD